MDSDQPVNEQFCENCACQNLPDKLTVTVSIVSPDGKQMHSVSVIGDPFKCTGCVIHHNGGIHTPINALEEVVRETADKCVSEFRKAMLNEERL